MLRKTNPRFGRWREREMQRQLRLRRLAPPQPEPPLRWRPVAAPKRWTIWAGLTALLNWAEANPDAPLALRELDATLWGEFRGSEFKPRKYQLRLEFRDPKGRRLGLDWIWDARILRSLPATVQQDALAEHATQATVKLMREALPDFDATTLTEELAQYLEAAFQEGERNRGYYDC